MSDGLRYNWKLIESLIGLGICMCGNGYFRVATWNGGTFNYYQFFEISDMLIKAEECIIGNFVACQRSAISLCQITVADN